MENSLISIIIPIYNSEKTLEKCLESVISQTYKNIEIVLIDDGSQDNSFNICKEYQQKDNRIVLLQQKNLGVSMARNYGLKVAKGQYIGFIDSDDYAENNMFEIMLKKMLEKKSKICICNYFFEDSKSNQIQEFENPDFTFSSSNLPQNMYNYLSINGYVCNKLYDRDLIFKDNIINVTMDENINMLEDNLFNYSIFDGNKNFECTYINKKLYHYVQHSSSACNTKYDYKKLQYFVVRDKQIRILEKKRN